MKFNRRFGGFGLCAVAAALLVGAGWWFTHHGNEPASVADESEAAAPVTTTTIRSGQVSQTVAAYGSVTAQPGTVMVLSAPLECIVKHLRVAAGQMVNTDQSVIEYEPSPDTRLALIDARNGLDSAKKQAASTQQRLNLKLATNTDADTADQAVRAAQAKLDDLISRGAGEKQKTIHAGDDAVVAKVDVQEGQLVSAGTALVELVGLKQIEVRLGVEPTHAMLLRSGQPVQLFPAMAESDKPVAGTIRLVTHEVNPESQLVDVFTTPNLVTPDLATPDPVIPAQSQATQPTPNQTRPLLLDEFVRGELTLKTASGLVIPHEALIPDDQGFFIFTIIGGHAVKHEVQIAVQNDKEAVISGDGLHEGDPVVIAGNLELDDNTAVTATAATMAPSGTEGEK